MFNRIIETTGLQKSASILDLEANDLNEPYQISRMVANTLRGYVQINLPSASSKGSFKMTNLFRQLDAEDVFFEKYGITGYSHPSSLYGRLTRIQSEGAEVVGRWGELLKEVIHESSFCIVEDSNRIADDARSETPLALLPIRQLDSNEVDDLRISQTAMEAIDQMIVEYKENVGMYRCGKWTWKAFGLMYIFLGLIALQILVPKLFAENRNAVPS